MEVTHFDGGPGILERCGCLAPSDGYLLSFFSDVWVVLVPSLCCVVVLLLACPVAGSEVELLLTDFPPDGSFVVEFVTF